MTLTVCRQASKALSVSAPQRLLKRLACRWVEARRHARRAKASARCLPRSAGRAKSLRAKQKSGVHMCSYACVRLFCTGSRSPQLPLPTSLDLRAHVRVRWEHSPSVSCLMSSVMQERSLPRPSRGQDLSLEFVPCGLKHAAKPVATKRSQTRVQCHSHVSFVVACHSGSRSPHFSIPSLQCGFFVECDGGGFASLQQHKPACMV